MADTPTTRASVVVVGGGYGGINTAKALDDVADVTLVDPTEAFVHNIAAWLLQRQNIPLSADPGAPLILQAT